MEEMDNRTEDAASHDEDELFMQHVVQNDHDLLYLDVCLNEICRAKQESGS